MSMFESDRMVFFGDSLVEAGTIFEITSQILTVPFPLQSAGYDRVFSDGRVFSQILPSLLGISVVENYAVGSARALGTREVADLGGGALEPLILPGADPALLGFDINFGAQIGRFLADEAAEPFAGHTTAAVLIGLNDISDFRPSGTGDPTAEAVELLAGVVTATIGAAALLGTIGGVDQVVFYTFPDPTFFPFSQLLDPALLPLAEQVYDGHEAAIRLGAAALELAGIVDTEVVDLGAIGAEISADLQTFGFLSFGPVLFGVASDPQLAPDGSLFFPENPAVAGLAPDQIVFYDFVHPTTALHGIWAAYSASVLEDRTFFLNDGANFSLATTGDDFFLAGAGNDTLVLRGGDDTAFAGLGNDRVSGWGGSDILAGGSGNDLLHGGIDADVVAGNLGDDLLIGGDGSDALIDGLGSDLAIGGEGNDAFFYVEASLIGGSAGVDLDRFFGGTGSDTLFLAVTDASRPAAEAAIAGGGGPLGAYEFSAFGLSLRGFEAVELLDRRDFGEAPVAPELQAALAEADLWGLV